MSESSMRVAMTVWNGRISPVFDVARRMLLFELTIGRVEGRREESLDGTATESQAERVTRLKPDVLICGAISRPLVRLLAECGIRVIPFVAGETESVIEAFRSGALPSPAWTMPGCCGRGRACGLGGRGRHGWARTHMGVSQ